MSIGLIKMASNVAASTSYSVSISPSGLLRENVPVGAATSNLATATIFAGAGPFTQQWTQVSGDAMTINSPTDLATAFTVSGSEGEFKSGSFQIEVTDTGNANAKTTALILVTFQFEGVIP